MKFSDFAKESLCLHQSRLCLLFVDYAPSRLFIKRVVTLAFTKSHTREQSRDITFTAVVP